MEKGTPKMNVAIMGFGVVGSGVAEVIASNADHIAKHSRVELRLSHILDIRDFPDSAFAAYLTKDVNDILSDDDTQIVVETMGGVEPAFTFVSACLKKGKHVLQIPPATAPRIPQSRGLRWSPPPRRRRPW